MLQNLIDLSRQLARGSVTSGSLIETALNTIEACDVEAGPSFLSVYAEKARTEAALVDQGRVAGVPQPRFSGIPIAIKDLFDVEGEVTRAGSHALDEQEPAKQDAAVVSRLRRAGFVVIGKNNMTEFAYSGLGVNAHFGTPINPCDPVVARVPGGSSSGAAVSVAQGMVPAAIGTDTGGSCRIPAAFCGLVGFKPSTDRIPKTGAVPLSPTLDCVGPLATSVSCCAVLDSILSGGEGADVDVFPEGGLRLGIPEGYVTDAMDDVVSAAYQDTLSRLSRRGVRLTPVSVNELAELPEINRKGGFVGAEAFAWHENLLETRGDHYDPWVRARFDSGRSQSAADYIRLFEHRKRLRKVVFRKLAHFDAFLLPTVQIVPPKLEDLATAEISNPTNLMCLRNTSIGNFLDCPAISIPCHRTGQLPVGMMLMGVTGDDLRLLGIAKTLEDTIRGPIGGNDTW